MSWLRMAFERDASLSSIGIVAWWEKRRILFNLVVGVTGILTCILMLLCALVAEPLVGTPIGLSDSPVIALFGIVLYGIAANVCYTGGWIVELIVGQRPSPLSQTGFGPKAFRYGMIFSVCLTVLPAVLSWLALLYSLVSRDSPEA